MQTELDCADSEMGCDRGTCVEAERCAVPSECEVGDTWCDDTQFTRCALNSDGCAVANGRDCAFIGGGGCTEQDGRATCGGDPCAELRTCDGPGICEHETAVVCE